MKRKASLTELFNQPGGHCAYCDKKMAITKTNSHDAPTRDHVIPRSEKGTGSKHNLVCACRECNVRKGSLPLSIFLAQLHKRHVRAVG